MEMEGGQWKGAVRGSRDEIPALNSAEKALQSRLIYSLAPRPRHSVASPAQVVQTPSLI